MSDYKEIKKYYDNYGSWYDYERVEGYYSFINDIETETVKQFGINKKTLEIGCGTGIILAKVAEFTKESWGVDLSSGMLEVARGKGLNVKEANATELPFKDNEFDITYSFKVLAHIPEIEKAIAEIKRVTKVDGKLILEFYNPYSFKFITNRISKNHEKVYIRYDSLEDIKRILGNDYEVQSIVGARIVTPVAFMLKVPVLNKCVVMIERLLCKTFLNRFAGYFIVVAGVNSRYE